MSTIAALEMMVQVYIIAFPLVAAATVKNFSVELENPVLYTDTNIKFKRLARICKNAGTSAGVAEVPEQKKDFVLV